MNIERGLRRLLVLVTLVLVLAVVAWRVFLSEAPASCAYLVVLADGTSGRIIAPQRATIEQVKIEARRLHPETKNPVVLAPLPEGVTAVLPPAPDEPAVPVPWSCVENERAFARLARYAYEVAAGTAIALLIAVVPWIAFFAFRWVAMGFKSAA
jgi:hypothetical protein